MPRIHDIADSLGIDVTSLAIGPRKVSTRRVAEFANKLLARLADLFRSSGARGSRQVRVIERVIPDLMSARLERLKIPPAHDLCRCPLEPLATPARNPLGITATIHNRRADEEAAPRSEVLKDPRAL